MSRTVALDLLKNVQIASPCTVDWNQMTGDDRARFCGECKLKVFNISAMTADEAAALLSESHDHLCIRLYRRADGTILTQDCPVGIRLARQKLARALARIAAAAALLIGGGITLATGSRENRTPRLASLQPFSTLRTWLSPAQPAPPLNLLRIQGGYEMGRKVTAPRSVTTTGAGQ